VACGSCGSRRPGQRAVPTRTTAGGGRTLYEVVLKTGAVAFQTNNVDLARSVQKNYLGSTLNPDPDAPAETAPTEEAVTISAPKRARTRVADRPGDEAAEVAPTDG
jgi:hypothetical protein